MKKWDMYPSMNLIVESCLDTKMTGVSETRDSFPTRQQGFSPPMTWCDTNGGDDGPRSGCGKDSRNGDGNSKVMTTHQAESGWWFLSVFRKTLEKMVSTANSPCHSPGN